MIYELQADRKRAESERADMQPMDWDTKRKALIGDGCNGLVASRAKKRELGIIRPGPIRRFVYPNYAINTVSGKKLHPITDPDEYRLTFMLLDINSLEECGHPWPIDALPDGTVPH